MFLTDRPGITIVDGGLSTQLEVMGYDISGPLWTGRALLEQPGAIEGAHRAFVEAGADVLITASYQVSRAGFIAAGLTADDADRCLLRSVEVARAAGAPSTIVAASVGPYGAIGHDGAEYRGNYGLSARQLRDFHRPRIEILAGGSPDLLAIETIPDVREVEAIADILADFPLLPAWLAFRRPMAPTPVPANRLKPPSRSQLRSPACNWWVSTAPHHSSSQNCSGESPLPRKRP